MPPVQFSLGTARTILVSLWVGAFVVTLGAVGYLYLDHWIERDQLLGVAKQLSDLYAPYVGAIILYSWGARREEAALDSARPAASFTLALILSAVWNLLVLALVLPVLPALSSAEHPGKIEDAIENLRELPGMFSWLVAGAMGFYFAQPATKEVGRAPA